MATVERKKEDGLQADAILCQVDSALNHSLVQLGGDATTGRGMVVLNFVGGNHG